MKPTNSCRSSIYLIAFTMLLLSVIGCQKEFDVAIVGQVVDVNNAAIAGATVSVTQFDGTILTATTDEVGRFQIIEQHQTIDQRNQIKTRVLNFQKAGYKDAVVEIDSNLVVGHSSILFCIVVHTVLTQPKELTLQ